MEIRSASATCLTLPETSSHRLPFTYLTKHISLSLSYIIQRDNLKINQPFFCSPAGISPVFPFPFKSIFAVGVFFSASCKHKRLFNFFVKFLTFLFLFPSFQKQHLQIFLSPTSFSLLCHFSVFSIFSFFFAFRTENKRNFCVFLPHTSLLKLLPFHPLHRHHGHLKGHLFHCLLILHLDVIPALKPVPAGAPGLLPPSGQPAWPAPPTRCRASNPPCHSFG